MRNLLKLSVIFLPFIFIFILLGFNARPDQDLTVPILGSVLLGIFYLTFAILIYKDWYHENTQKETRYIRVSYNSHFLIPLLYMVYWWETLTGITVLLTVDFPQSVLNYGNMEYSSPKGLYITVGSATGSVNSTGYHIPRPKLWGMVMLSLWQGYTLPQTTYYGSTEPTSVWVPIENFSRN